MLQSSQTVPPQPWRLPGAEAPGQQSSGVQNSDSLSSDSAAPLCSDAQGRERNELVQVPRCLCCLPAGAQVSRLTWAGLAQALLPPAALQEGSAESSLGLAAKATMQTASVEPAGILPAGKKEFTLSFQCSLLMEPFVSLETKRGGRNSSITQSPGFHCCCSVCVDTNHAGEGEESVFISD